jgi:hypothetical protein
MRLKAATSVLFDRIDTTAHLHVSCPETAERLADSG